MSRYSGATPLTDDLFGFKYILSCYDNRYGNIKSPSDITVTKNEDAMPIAYLVDPKVFDYRFECSRFEDNVFTNQSKLLSYMLGEEDNGYFVRMEPTDRRPQNLIIEGMGDGYTSYARGGEPVDAHIEYDIVADETGDFYMYFPSRYERECNLWIVRYDEHGIKQNDVFLGKVYETDNHHIQYLGHFKKGEKFQMTLSLTQDKAYFRDEKIVRLDRRKLEADIARLHRMNIGTEFKMVNKRKLRITTNNSQDMLLFTSIPVEPGWKAKLNGKTVEIEELLEVIVGKDKGSAAEVRSGSLMGIKVPAGTNVIELKFFPNYMPLGIFLSFVGIGGVAALWYFMPQWQAKRRRKDELIATTDDYEGFDSDYVDCGKEGLNSEDVADG